MSRLLRRLFSRTPVRHRRAPRVRPASYFRSRLLLQSLEARDVPATITVTNANDAGTGSLRAAIQTANTSAGVADTINLPAGTYVLNLTGAGEDAAATGDLDIWDDLKIRGAGAGATIVDGAAADRLQASGNRKERRSIPATAGIYTLDACADGGTPC